MEMELREDTALVESDKSAASPGKKVLFFAGYLSSFTIAVMDSVSLGCAQALGGYVPQFQLNMWRFLTQFAICLPIVAYRGLNIRIDRKSIPFVLVICIAYNVANVTQFGASIYLPTGTVFCLWGALFLVFVCAINVILNKECLAIHIWVSIILVLTGIVFITQPEFLFGKDEYPIRPVCPRETATQVYLTTENMSWISIHPSGNLTGDSLVGHDNGTFDSYKNVFPIYWAGTTIGYTYIVTSAISITVITFCISKKLREVDVFVLGLWVSSTGVIVSVIGMGIFETPMFPSETTCQLLLMGHAVSVSSINIFNAVALLYVRTEMFALISNMAMVLLFLAQYTVLKKVNPGHRNVTEIVGAMEIFVGNCLGPVFQMIKDLKGKAKAETEES